VSRLTAQDILPELPRMTLEDLANVSVGLATELAARLRTIGTAAPVGPLLRHASDGDWRSYDGGRTWAKVEP
jgi:hypothetical protein